MYMKCYFYLCDLITLITGAAAALGRGGSNMDCEQTEEEAPHWCKHHWLLIS
jgi:hypothetical protein